MFFIYYSCAGARKTHVSCELNFDYDKCDSIVSKWIWAEIVCFWSHYWLHFRLIVTKLKVISLIFASINLIMKIYNSQWTHQSVRRFTHGGERRRASSTHSTHAAHQLKYAGRTTCDCSRSTTTLTRCSFCTSRANSFVTITELFGFTFTTITISVWRSWVMMGNSACISKILRAMRGNISSVNT